MKLDEAHAGLVLADIWVTSCYMNITDKNTHTHTHMYIIYIYIYPGYSLVTNFFPGQIYFL